MPTQFRSGHLCSRYSMSVCGTNGNLNRRRTTWLAARYVTELPGPSVLKNHLRFYIFLIDSASKWLEYSPSAIRSPDTSVLSAKLVIRFEKRLNFPKR